MEPAQIIAKLATNREVFAALLKDKSKEEIFWKPNENKWCLLEIVCHLFDEEREDFKTRVRTTLELPGSLPPPIDPIGWVTERKYIEKDYDEVLANFLKERTTSIAWLQDLKDPEWENRLRPLPPWPLAHLFRLR